ncbi:tumor protein p63-regulated gene 1-like protein isoform X1 [Schistocerca gregaria]|uniref:tumor protein p63-regulated gene 1-like protein isoform X1 n=1 Tax=Schistocerca gregaria TaxID=7010 RepID=UPI00211EF4B4|nr:tumor protein p63-regulated gene 1-like protein isoform X1 [Schistocerca gregaria]
MNEEQLLEDGPNVDFRGVTLQIQHDADQSRSPSSQGDSDSVAKLSLSPDAGNEQNRANKESGDLKPAISSGTDVISPITSIPRKISEHLKKSHSKEGSAVQSDAICQNSALEHDNAKDYFTYRDGIVENAVKECVEKILVPEKDGEFIGSWLMTEISFWDNEKERLVLLSSATLTTVKYDFIALKQLEYRKVPLDLLDTLVIGDLIYPPGSLVPRLNGLATGVVTVVKGCLLRPLQERWSHTASAEFCANPFDIRNFEPRSRNVRGLRAMWNRGEPLTFTKRWNPFNSDIPFTTYTSHPLLWHKDGDSNKIYDVEDFARKLVDAVEHIQKEADGPVCRVEHKSIVLQNYVGLGSVIHNKNSLGFFKVQVSSPATH